MQTAANLATNFQPPNEPKNEDVNSSKGSINLTALVYFWVRMAAIFGNSWTSQYGDGPDGVAGGEWGQAIAGFSRAELDTGLNHCRILGAQWPPSMGEFRGLCLAIPCLAQVRREIHADTRSAFSLMVVSGLDMYTFKRVDTDRAERMLKDAYQDARTRRLMGEPLPEVLTQIGYAERLIVPASDEVRNAAFDEIQATLAATP